MAVISPGPAAHPKKEISKASPQVKPKELQAPIPTATPTDRVDLSDETRSPEQSYPSTTIDTNAVVNTDDRVERNQMVTDSYHELSQDFDDFLNPGGKEDAGNNWFDYAKWASREVGDGIRGHGLPPGTRLTGADEAMSDGNTIVFEDIAPDAQDFLKTFGNDTEFDQEKFDEWAARFSEEGEGGELKAEAFKAYYEARFTDDAKRRQELTLLGNLLIAEHEQKLLDPVIDLAFDPIDNSGIAGDILQHIPPMVSPEVVDQLGEIGARVMGNPDLKVPDGNGNFVDLPLKQDLVGEVPPSLRQAEEPRLQATLDEWGASTNSLDGTGTSDWPNLDRRMQYIAQLMKLNAFNDDLGRWNPQQGLALPDLPRVAGGPDLSCPVALWDNYADLAA